ncbi:MAG TPA: hypothetical protein VMN36_11475 [Verrucomicrobiales bacterium]|nr:hypothetical protein [Verrucomicrobiales bacterium]
MLSSAFPAWSPRFLPLCIALAAALLPSFLTSGQEAGDETGETDPRVSEVPDSQRFWECALDGGSFLIPLDHIVTVSQHEYVVDGVARVYEATLSTNSSIVARFYFLEPAGGDSTLTSSREALNRAQSFLEEASGRAGVDPVWKKVVKNYPTTTHAHTVEYRLQQKSDVARIYSSIRRCLRTGRGTQISIRNP